MYTYLLIFLGLFGASSPHQLFIRNDCSLTVWVGILPSNGILPDEGGFELSAGLIHIITVPTYWSGRVWGRTYCDNIKCLTGDCGKGWNPCNGSGGAPPVTLVEITFDSGSGNDMDFYDVSLVDGFNLPMSIVPVNGYQQGGDNKDYCAKSSCNYDINDVCPPNNFSVYGTGGVVACKSACLALNKDEYCCRGAYNKSETCPPSMYSKHFKEYCPNAYSYAFDDPSSTFTCNNISPGSSSYNITFCDKSDFFGEHIVGAAAPTTVSSGVLSTAQDMPPIIVIILTVISWTFHRFLTN